MALQTSGAISLNDIHVEAGGTSGTQASINDADIRGLIGKSSGAQMSFNEWYGASAGIFSNTVNLTLTRTNLGNTDFKGNFTLTGYSFNLSVQNWNNLNGSSMGNRIGNFSASDTTVPSSGLNPMGVINGTTYDCMSFLYAQTTNTVFTPGSRSSSLTFWHNNRGGSVYPTWSATNSQPTNWTALNLTFTYGGTNYDWTWTRASHVLSWGAIDFTFSGATSQGYYNLAFSDSGSTVFTGNNSSTTQTITGAKFTLT